MNRKFGVRFTNGLSSGLSIFILLGIAYALEGSTSAAIAGDNLSAKKSNASQEDERSVPGVFKNLTGKSDTITAKKNHHKSIVIPAKSIPATQHTVDANKGIIGKSVEDGAFEGAIDFQATAYCLKGKTASGEHTRRGVIAADPRVLPLGTMVHIRAGKYTGTYKVTDTGGLIRGRKIDIYVPTYKEAVQFGRQRVKIKVLTAAERRKTPGLKK